MPDRESPAMADRQYDVVVFGATGFTGALTAEYLSIHADEGTRWALAGRSRQKLEDVRRRLGPPSAELPLIEADVNDPASMRALAESTKVVITTVGPYINYGEPVVAACAAAGTDYVDLTGEPEFVDLMWLRHHATAERNGARLVHSCGFDSIPYDLGTLFTVQHLPEGVPLSVEGFVRAGGTFSGGTYHSAVHAMGRLRQSVRVARERRQQETGPNGRR
ncbi:MAG TPA: saccharopine dehydrogenase NADP-binding domain-containing protein, partial [Solirubrobacteraceae bacterium]|nr:saccharopine dehydrogenase NADP-binding domain-containing protein [Solirubrobacteraceae bacterium]